MFIIVFIYHTQLYTENSSVRVVLSDGKAFLISAYTNGALMSSVRFLQSVGERKGRRRFFVYLPQFIVVW
jgi:hypothetical protein